jgi:hypothetical protein
VTLLVPAAAARTTRGAVRDPVLVVPLLVAVGLAVGALGVGAHVSGARIATDVGLAWALTAAAIVTLERPRQRRATWLLAAAALALLGADLGWASADALWTLALLLEQLWIAFLAALLLAFPEARSSTPLTRLAVAATFVVTLGGQAVGVLVDTDPRDLLAVARHPGIASAVDRVQEIAGVVLALVILLLVVRRLRALRGPARRSQGPVLAASVVTIQASCGW